MIFYDQSIDINGITHTGISIDINLWADPGARISTGPQVGSSLAWSPCGRRVAVGSAKHPCGWGILHVLQWSDFSLAVL